MEKTDKSAEEKWLKPTDAGYKWFTCPTCDGTAKISQDKQYQMNESAQQLSEYKEVIKELLPLARSVVYNTSISTEEGRKNVREIQVVIDRAKKLID